LKVEIEAEGQNGGTNHIEYIIVRLINEDAGTSGETQVKVELQIEPEPATVQGGVSGIPSSRPSFATSPPRTSKLTAKSWGLALFLSISMGALGVDRFYLGDVVGGFLKIAVTIGSVTLANVTNLYLLCLPYFVWWIIDIILIATRRL
jgi:TM2 domain-containing membrane protein YozV